MNMQPRVQQSNKKRKKYHTISHKIIKAPSTPKLIGFHARDNHIVLWGFEAPFKFSVIGIRFY